MCKDHKKIILNAFNKYPERHDYPEHKPIGAFIGCIDGREGAGKYFNEAFGDHVIRFTGIAGIYPPYEQATIAEKAELSFQKIKEVGSIMISGHSFCGGAQTAYAYPNPDDAPNEDIGYIVQSIARSGADLPRLKDAFYKACEGNDVKASNLLARHLVLHTLQNISGYPSIFPRVLSKELDLLPIFHVLKQDDVGAPSYLERYDVAKQQWRIIDKNDIEKAHDDDHFSNMCARPNACGSCVSCHNTIEQSLEWVTHQLAGNQMVELPRHISLMLKDRMEEFQPRLARERAYQNAYRCDVA